MIITKCLSHCHIPGNRTENWLICSINIYWRLCYMQGARNGAMKIKSQWLQSGKEYWDNTVLSKISSCWACIHKNMENLLKCRSWFSISEAKPESESVSGVAQSCPSLCDLVDCSPPGSSVHGILQTRILEWVAISFSRGSSWPRDRTQVSHIAGRCFNLWATGKPSRQSQVFYNSNKHLCGTYNVERWTTSWVQEQWQSPGLHPLNHLCKMQMCDSHCRFWSIYYSLNSMDNSKADPSMGTTDVTQSPHITGDWRGLIINDQVKQDSGLQAEEGEGGMNWESSTDIYTLPFGDAGDVGSIPRPGCKMIPWRKAW